MRLSPSLLLPLAQPNYYEGTQGANLTAKQYLQCCFVRAWGQYAQTLSCPCTPDKSCCSVKEFAGPVWGHVNMQPGTLQWFLKCAAYVQFAPVPHLPCVLSAHSLCMCALAYHSIKMHYMPSAVTPVCLWHLLHCAMLSSNLQYIGLATVHYYKATREAYNTAATLLEEAPIRKDMANLRALVGVAAALGVPLRVAEMNTISNSGRVGVSNVLAAALWTLDCAFEVAAAGAVGINVHQGSGQSLYTALLRRSNHSSPLIVRPPFLGMLMFQQAVGSGSQLLTVTEVDEMASPHLKVWPLMDVDPAKKELRFVLINKHPSEAGLQTVRLNRQAGYTTAATVTRLVAQGDDPLSATSGITLGGYHYAVGGVKHGMDASELVPVEPGTPAWRIHMPPGSAALVRVPFMI
jgi:hypothetical protein